MTTAVSCAAGNLREQILSAAASCFRERGIKATTMQEIAKRAGISVGNFYNYFDGKDAIIDEFAQREVARLARESSDAQVRELIKKMHRSRASADVSDEEIEVMVEMDMALVDGMAFRLIAHPELEVDRMINAIVKTVIR